MVGYSSTNGLTSDFHYRTCFGQCSTDGSCTAPATANDVTFRVDMNNVTASFTNVYVSGLLMDGVVILTNSQIQMEMECIQGHYH
jgi:hypothetical protein